MRTIDGANVSQHQYHSYSGDARAHPVRVQPPRPGPGTDGPPIGRVRALVAAVALMASALVLAAGTTPASAATVTTAYVVNSGSDTVSVIDTTTDTVLTTIPVPGAGDELAVNPQGTRALVTTSGGVTVIDTATDTVIATITTAPGVGVAVTDVVFHPYAPRAYVTNSAYNRGDDRDSVSVIDTFSNTVLMTIPVADEPQAVAATPDGLWVYVTSSGDGDPSFDAGIVSVISTFSNAVETTVPVVPGSNAVAVNQAGTRAYVTGGTAFLSVLPDGVSVIDTATNTVVATIPVENPTDVVVSPDDTRVYVTTSDSDQGPGSVTVIDAVTDTVVATIPVVDEDTQDQPESVAVTPDGARLYVTISAGPFSGVPGRASVIDTTTNAVVTSIPTGIDPSGVAIATVPVDTNDPPAAVDDVYGTDEDVALVVAAPGVLGNDSDTDPGDPLGAALVSGPAHGTVTVDGDGSFTYTPAPDFNGSDRFTYQATDAAGALSGVATVTVTVGAVNDAPVAVDDAYGTDEDVALVVAAPGVLGNDSDTDPGDPLGAALVSGAAHGTVTVDGDGSFTYTPAPDFNGSDRFTYQATDAAGALSGVATVTVTVRAVNDPPVCSAVRPDLFRLWSPDHSMRLITLSGATDPDGDPVMIEVTGVTQDEPVNGSGDGNTAPDAEVGPASNQVLLRAERSGRGDGRVYRVGFRASDPAGGFCEATVEVGVPTSENGTAAVESPLVVNSFGR